MPSTRDRRVQYSQNFLHNRRLVASLVERSSLTDRDLVIEIGPGKGILTDALADRARHVLAIEKDPHQAGIARSRFRDRSNVSVFLCDFLDFPLPESPYKVFANIPYRYTSAIVAKLTTGVAPPEEAWLTMQAEAAARYSGESGETMVSICLKPWFDLAIAYRFRRRDFVPQPAVDSVLMRVRKRQHPLISWDDRDRFIHLVEGVFSAWQPTVERALRKLLPAESCNRVIAGSGIALAVKPSDLAPQDWVRLFRRLDDLGDDRCWSALAHASNDLRRQQQGLVRPTRTRARPSRQRNRS